MGRSPDSIGCVSHCRLAVCEERRTWARWPALHRHRLRTLFVVTLKGPSQAEVPAAAVSSGAPLYQPHSRAFAPQTL